jgi:hypothetical protein
MFENDCKRAVRACDEDCALEAGEARDLWRTDDRCEYGLGDKVIGGDDNGRGLRWAGMGECELA